MPKSLSSIIPQKYEKYGFGHPVLKFISNNFVSIKKPVNESRSVTDLLFKDKIRSKFQTSKLSPLKIDSFGFRNYSLLKPFISMQCTQLLDSLCILQRAHLFSIVTVTTKVVLPTLTAIRDKRLTSCVVISVKAEDKAHANDFFS